MRKTLAGSALGWSLELPLVAIVLITLGGLLLVHELLRARRPSQAT